MIVFRSIIALGHLVMSCDQTLYIKLMSFLMEELAKSGGSTQNTRTYIQVIIQTKTFEILTNYNTQSFLIEQFTLGSR